MTDLKQEARMLTLGERMVLAARLAVLEHLRQSVTAVPSGDLNGSRDLDRLRSAQAAALAELAGVR